MNKYMVVLMFMVTWCVYVVGMENGTEGDNQGADDFCLEMLSELRKVQQKAVEHDERMRDARGLERAFDKKQVYLLLLASAEEDRKKEQKWEKHELSLRGKLKDHRSRGEREFLAIIRGTIHDEDI